MKRYEFDYGEFVAEKVRKEKIKKGKRFTDEDFKRIAKKVNETLAQHQR